MPRKPSVPCRGSAFCAKPGPYCEDHRGVRKVGERKRASSAARGYDHRWRKVRKKKAAKNPLCEPCQRAGRAVPLDMVDHIIPLRAGGARLDMRNLESQCWPCHGAKTEADKLKYPEAYDARK